MALKKRKAKKKVVRKKPVKKVRAKVVKKRVTEKRVVKKKGIKKSPVASKKKPQAKGIKKVKENIAGKITHYFPHVQAAVIKLKAPLSIGDTIKIKGHTTDFTQSISSMQIDHVVVNSARIGQEIGLLVNSRVRQHDLVYKI